MNLVKRLVVCFRLVKGFLCCDNRGSLILLFWLLLALSGCTTIKYVPVETIKTEYKTETIHDSIYLEKKDSIFVYQKGDTMLVEKWHTIYRDKIVEKTDTFLRTDTITNVVEVEKSLSWWERKKIEFGELAMFIIVGLFVIVIFKILRK